MEKYRCYMPFSSSRKNQQYLLYFYKQHNMKMHNSKLQKRWKLSVCINNYSFGANEIKCFELIFRYNYFRISKR